MQFFSDCFHFERKNKLLKTLSIYSIKDGDSDMGTQVGDIGSLGLEGTLPAELKSISPEPSYPQNKRTVTW